MISKEEVIKIINFYESEITRYKKEIDNIAKSESSVNNQSLSEHLQKEGQKVIAKYQSYITEFEKVMSEPNYEVNRRYVIMIIQDYKNQKENLKGSGLSPINEEVVKILSNAFHCYGEVLEL